MNFSDHPPFVWPFLAGMAFIFVYLPLVYLNWLRKGKLKEFRVMPAHIFSSKTLLAVKEIFSECLLHRRIFRFNRRLGYMHMSLAFGWFLLIVVGKAETMLFTHDGFNPPYLPVFFKYFYPSGIPHTFKGYFFLTLMDLLLLFVLSGLFLAFYKRFRSRRLGMTRTTRHILPDRIALTFLWMIFPFRWFAESVTAGLAGSGGFFTLGSGKLLAGILPLDLMQEPAWWAYSVALGGFFFALPFSRYMHIFTEAVMILLKHWGMKTPERDNGYGDFELNACSRCGICTNVCQLSADAGITHSQAVYFLRDARYGLLERDTAENCFLCGRCSRACPVEIGVDELRLAARRRFAGEMAAPVTGAPRRVNGQGTFPGLNTRTGSGLKNKGVAGLKVDVKEGMKGGATRDQKNGVEVLYFGGCMSHLTPGIMAATRTILEKAGISFAVLDEQETLCCGRPAMQAGLEGQAREIIARLSERIRQSGASLLLVSCPICYRVFREEYHLPIPVEHHTRYFSRLVTSRPALFHSSSLRMSYHDPCDLGRGSGIYEEPRKILRHTGTLVPVPQEREDALCCGGSLANLAITPRQRQQVTDAAYAHLTAEAPDFVVTSCPLCKKTFAAGKRPVPVIDIAEALAFSMTGDTVPTRLQKSTRELVAP